MSEILKQINAQGQAPFFFKSNEIMFPIATIAISFGLAERIKFCTETTEMLEYTLELPDASVCSYAINMNKHTGKYYLGFRRQYDGPIEYEIAHSSLDISEIIKKMFGHISELLVELHLERS